MNNDTQKPAPAEAASALRDASSCLAAAGIPFRIDGGTLLGFWRDGTFCEDDQDDIDLTASANDWCKAKTLTALMLAAGFEPYREWNRDETLHRSGQLAFKRNGVKIDLMFKETKGGMEWWTVYGGKRGVTYKAVPIAMSAFGHNAEFFLPDGNPMTLTLPTDPEKYLAYRYGDWKTKVHRSEYSCYSTDLAILEPNAYESV